MGLSLTSSCMSVPDLIGLFSRHTTQITTTQPIPIEQSAANQFPSPRMLASSSQLVSSLWNIFLDDALLLHNTIVSLSSDFRVRSDCMKKKEHFVACRRPVLFRQSSRFAPKFQQGSWLLVPAWVSPALFLGAWGGHGFWLAPRAVSVPNLGVRCPVRVSWDPQMPAEMLRWEQLTVWKLQHGSESPASTSRSRKTRAPCTNRTRTHKQDADRKAAFVERYL
jgi:hypothetical protein